jgi:hypothetical protein
MRRVENDGSHGDTFRCSRFGKKIGQIDPILLSRPFQPLFGADPGSLVPCWDDRPNPADLPTGVICRVTANEHRVTNPVA